MSNRKEVRINITQFFEPSGTLPQEDLFKRFEEIREEFEVQRKKFNSELAFDQYGLAIKYWNKDDIQLWIYSDIEDAETVLMYLSANVGPLFNKTGGYYASSVCDIETEEFVVNKIAEADAKSK